MEYKGKVIYERLDILNKLCRSVRNGTTKKDDAMLELRRNYINTIEYLNDIGRMNWIEFDLQLMSLQNDSMDIEREYQQYVNHSK